jgi:hypothetical protein
MKRFLVFLQETGGWLIDDPFRIRLVTVRAAARLGWARVTFDHQGQPESATITALGRAAYNWGHASVIEEQ